MAVNLNPGIVTTGLNLSLDAADTYNSILTNVETLIVGGGGGGGKNLVGAGGGGGVIYMRGLSIPNQSYTITVGAGGSGAPSNGSATEASGSAGSLSSAFGETAGGGQTNTISTHKSGNSGTAVISTSASLYEYAIAYSNNTGGTASGNAGAGGGGAGAAGVNHAGNSDTLGTKATNGGDGIFNNILGIDYYWAGGGGGEGYSSYGGDGGAGGGGGGGVFPVGGTNPGAGGVYAINSGTSGSALNNSTNGGAAGANTGGGGGGGSHTGASQTNVGGGAGGSGIVVVRYKGRQRATGGTITTIGNYTVHKFTSTSTFSSLAWADSSGNGTLLSLNSGATYSSASRGVIVFDGVDDNVSGLQSSFMSGSATGTFEAWINTSSITNGGTSGSTGLYNVIIGKESANTSGLGFNSSGNVRLRLGSTNLDGSTVVPLNTWTQIAGTWDTTGMKVYVNGVLDGSNSTANKTFEGSANATLIGRIAAASTLSSYSGQLSNLKAYNRALTAAEINQNYNAQKSRFGL